MDPAIVWVVETGMPSHVAPNSASAPPPSAQKPCIGVRWVMREPIVRTIRQPPNNVPSAIALWQLSTTQNGTWNAAAQESLRVEQHSDDPHGLLGVIAAMSQAEQRRGDELQARGNGGRRQTASTRTASHDVATTSSIASSSPISGDSTMAEPITPTPPQTTAAGPALAIAAPISPPTSAWLLLEGMPQPPCQHVPHNRTGERAEDHERVDHRRIHDAAAHRLRRHAGRIR